MLCSVFMVLCSLGIIVRGKAGAQSPPAYYEEVTGETLQCINNNVARYPCQSVMLEAFLPLMSFIDTTSFDGSDSIGDVWGWTDPVTKKDFAIVGLHSKTSFFDISIPNSPVYIGDLGSHNGSRGVRDMKTVKNTLYIVGMASNHGMQIFDLSQLTSLTSSMPFSETAYYEFEQHEIAFTIEEGYARNIAINEDTKYAYVVGSQNCNGGIYSLDISNQLSPRFSGCYSEDGYIRDTHCTTYSGPDTKYQGSELCFAITSYSLSIIDVSSKSSMKKISKLSSISFSRIGQGWLTEDQKYVVIGDIGYDGQTTTYLVDVSNLEFPTVVDTHRGASNAKAGNSFVTGDYVYQASHDFGMSVLRINNDKLEYEGYFDTYVKSTDGTGGDGAVGVFPFFDSGITLIGSKDEGLYVVRADYTTTPTAYPSSLSEIGLIRSPRPSPGSKNPTPSLTSKPTPEIKLNVLLSPSLRSPVPTQVPIPSEIWQFQGAFQYDESRRFYVFLLPIYLPALIAAFLFILVPGVLINICAHI